MTFPINILKNFRWGFLWTLIIIAWIILWIGPALALLILSAISPIGVLGFLFIGLPWGYALFKEGDNYFKFWETWVEKWDPKG